MARLTQYNKKAVQKPQVLVSPSAQRLLVELVCAINACPPGVIKDWAKNSHRSPVRVVSYVGSKLVSSRKGVSTIAGSEVGALLVSSLASKAVGNPGGVQSALAVLSGGARFLSVRFLFSALGMVALGGVAVDLLMDLMWRLHPYIPRDHHPLWEVVYRSKQSAHLPLPGEVCLV